MPKDEYGIEYDNDVEAALKDPKGGLLAKVVEYLTKRDAAKTKQEAEQAENERKKKQPKGLFSGLFGDHF